MRLNDEIKTILPKLYNPAYYNNRIGKYKTRIEVQFILEQLKGKGHNSKILDLGGGVAESLNY